MGLAAAVVLAASVTYLRPWERQAAAPAPVLTSVRSVSVQQFQFLSAVQGWVVTGDSASSSLFRTVDGGRHWERQLDGVGGQGWVLHFFDAMRGVLYAADVRGTALWRTGDRGRHWARTRLPATTAPGLAYFADPDHGWCLTPLEVPAVPTVPIAEHMDFSLFRTIDGGASWSEVLATNRGQPVSHGLGDDGMKTWIWFLDAEVGWIGQGTTGGHAVVYGTSDGGNDWIRQELPQPTAGWGSALGVSVARPMPGGSGSTLLTAWPLVPVQSGTPTAPPTYFFAWHAPSWTGPAQLPSGTFGLLTVGPDDESRWWVTDGVRLLETNDAGVSWRPAGRAPTGWLFERVAMVDAGHGWAQLEDPKTCSSGLPCMMILARSTDGGQHWTVLRSPV